MFARLPAKRLVAKYNSPMRAVITPAIASNLHLVGDRWSLLILRDLFAGRNRFEALQTHTGAGRATLTRRLNSLMEGELVDRVPYSEGRFEYHLTRKGQGLYAAAMCAWAWEQQFAPTADGGLPGSLIHESCGAPLNPQVICRACEAPLTRAEIRLDPGTNFQEQVLSIQAENGSRRRRNSGPGDDDNMTNIASLVGDRWSILILVAMFFGVARFDEFHRLLGIATNILGARLNRLMEAGVLRKEPYQQNPVRYRYLLSESGEALFGFVMAVWQWAKVWTPEGEAANALAHECGAALVVDVVCASCENSLTLNS
jgi:DNA-binding HxlR family transcriptional regulator